MKTCYRCSESKPLTEFHVDRNAKDGLSHGCKPCNRARVNAYREANIETVRAKLRERGTRPEVKAQRRESNLRRYGIGPEDYDRLLSEQGGGCAICGRETDQRKDKALAVDHCHETGQVRGILCSWHNRALGLFADDIGHLLKAVDYLMQFKDVLREECIERLETATTS